MVVTLWEGHASFGGLSVSETEVWRMAVMQERARRGHTTLTKRRRNAPKVRQPSNARNESGLTRKNSERSMV